MKERGEGGEGKRGRKDLSGKEERATKPKGSMDKLDTSFVLTTYRKNFNSGMWRT